MPLRYKSKFGSRGKFKNIAIIINCPDSISAEMYAEME
jgi:hypothetical protein